MRFLKTLIWVTVIVGMIVFAVNNWVPASVKLWGGLWLDSKLPALMIGSFIVGFVPLYIWHRGLIWRLKRRLASFETASRPAPLDVGREGIFPPSAPQKANPQQEPAL
jgi:lipopolysaccharide assembly protein A